MQDMASCSWQKGKPQFPSSLKDCPSNLSFFGFVLSELTLLLVPGVRTSTPSYSQIMAGVGEVRQ